MIYYLTSGVLSLYINGMKVSDTIPRVTHLVQFEAILDGLNEGLAFDELRKRLWQVALDLARISGGREPSGHPEYYMWSPAKDALEDLMRAGWIKKAPLPSVQQRVNAYRSTRYELTDVGLKWARAKNAGEARELIGRALLEQHPYFRQYLERLMRGAMLVPEFSESDITHGSTPETLDYSKISEEAIRRMEMSPARNAAKATEFAEQTSLYVRRRFAKSRPKNRKALLDAVLDAVLGAVLKAEGMGADPASFVIISSWSRELFLTGSSRYVLESPGGWLHWIGADIRIDGASINYTRRGLHQSGDVVASMLGTVVNQLKQPGTELVKIYPLRGTVAFRCGVANEIVDRIILALVTKRRDSPYEISLSAGALFDPPKSEWPLSFSGRKYHLIALRNKEK